MARGVHEAEKAAPADSQDVDAPETQALPHALGVGDELILRALLDRDPLGAAVAAMVVEDQPEPERLGQRRQGAAQPGGIGAGSAV
jgi:hypothetical protein